MDSRAEKSRQKEAESVQHSRRKQRAELGQCWSMGGKMHSWSTEMRASRANLRYVMHISKNSKRKELRKFAKHGS
jgi:hypothetical protein